MQVLACKSKGGVGALIFNDTHTEKDCWPWYPDDFNTCGDAATDPSSYVPTYGVMSVLQGEYLKVTRAKRGCLGGTHGRKPHLCAATWSIRKCRHVR